MLMHLILSKCIAQNNFPRVEKITTNEKILHGYIDNKYPITIYLKAHQPSGFHKRIHKLKGWYYYDKIKTKIPLVGINGEQIILYQLNNEKAFFNKALNGWNDLNDFENIEDYVEKFVITTQESKWLTKGKELKVSMYLNDFSIHKQDEFLRLTKEKTFNLNQLKAKDFSLVSYKNNRFILAYEHQSKPNVVGHCGAGTEIGYILMVFNTKGLLEEITNFPIESCLENIYAEELHSKKQNEIIYNVSNASDEVSHQLIINKELVTIKKIAKNN